MAERITLTGMVIKAVPVGEYDKRIVLLTLERGKVTAFARGARRPKGTMVAAANLFCFGRFEAYEGRDSYTVVKAEISNYFREFGTELELNYYGCYCLEVADYFCAEADPGCSNVLRLLYRTLQALLAGQVDLKLIRGIYELKMLVFNGTCPDFFSCGTCGKHERLIRFDLSRHSMICADCVADRRGIAIDAATLYALQFIVASPVEKLYTFRLKEEVQTALLSIIRRLFQSAVDRPLTTEQFL